MAQFRNVSGQDLDLSLPDWFEPRRVEADGVVEVDDSLIYSGPPEPEVVDGVQQPVPADHHLGTYEFSPAVWERVDASPAKRRAPEPVAVDDEKNGGN